MLFIFDMGGVVTTTFDLSLVALKCGMSIDEFKSICKKDFNILKDFEKGNINTKEFWEIFNSRIENTNFKKVEHDLFRLLFNPVLNPETCKIIKKLRSKHRVVCGTNTIDSHLENHTERGDYSYFDKTYPSNKINCAKPDVEFFKLIMEFENATPNETFFVDDKIENVNAALSLGINAVQFTSAKELYKKWKNYF